MQVTKISDNYEYWYFDNQEEYFLNIEKLLNLGYQFSDRVNICVELKKENHFILLSILKVEKITSDIKLELAKFNVEYKLVKPNYKRSMLNIISSIRNYFGYHANYETDQHIDEILSSKSYKNIVIMLLDGLGENILEYNAKPDSFLKKYHSYTNTSIYPSTTAASTTATKNGLAPIVTGWLGWENYFHEIKRNIVLFTGRNYVTNEETGFNPYKVIPYQFFFADMDVNGQIIEPDFNEVNYKFKDVLKKSLKNFKKEVNNIQYVYFTQPDTIMHEYGSYSKQALDIIAEIDQELVSYVNNLPEDTLLIISADHGHTNVLPIELWACETINKRLKRRPSNDSRCISFSVKYEYKKDFMKIFNSLFGYAYQIYPTAELIADEYFGLKTDVINERSKDFLGDFIAIGINNYYFNYRAKDDAVFKSHHAGITADEMLVPVVIYGK